MGLVGVVILYLIVSIVPSLEKARGLIESSIFFWDDTIRDKYDIGSSSMSMRIDQITYPFYEIRDNLLFGHGFGWASYYLSRNAFHPVMYGFENLASEALCNGGICGLSLWLWFFWKSYKYSSLYDGEKMYYALFSIVQFTIAMASGLSYLVFYGIFIVLLNKFYLLKNEENISCNGSLQ